MKVIDPHIHMSVRVTDDYEAMKKAGYVAVVEPAFWAGSDKHYAQSFFDYFNHLLTFEHDRARKYGLYHYSFVCINAKEARNPIAREVVNGIEDYLDHENCLGVGEVGLDMITPGEIDICREQIKICEKHKALCIIHTPHVNKRVGVEKIFKILEEEKVDMNRYIMDHNNEETMEISRRYPDIYIGMTLYPTKVSIDRAAELIKTYGAHRVMLNSSADWGKSYPLMVSEAGTRLPGLGVSPEDTAKVTYGNAYEFYSQSPKFRIG